MANVDSPFGFKLARASSPNKGQNEYTIASGYAANIFTGDVVEMTGTGRNVAVVAAANVDNVGVFVGCKYTIASGEVVYSKYWPTGTVSADAVAFVIDDPGAEFEVQASTGQAPALADVGTLCDLIAGAGSTLTGVSGFELDMSSAATTAKTFRVRRFVDRPDNEVGAHAKLIVTFAEHILGTGAAGAGGI